MEGFEPGQDRKVAALRSYFYVKNTLRFFFLERKRTSYKDSMNNHIAVVINL